MTLNYSYPPPKKKKKKRKRKEKKRKEKKKTIIIEKLKIASMTNSIYKVSINFSMLLALNIIIRYKLRYIIIYFFLKIKTYVA